MEQALDPHLAWYDLILGGSRFGEEIQKPYAAKFKLHKHSSVAEIERICGAEYVDDYYLFSVVRHPLARACSLYNFVASTLSKWAGSQNVKLEEVALHITKEATRKKPGLKWATSRAFMETRNFSEFIRHEKVAGAPGFRTQASSLRNSSGDLKGQFYRIEEHDKWTVALADRLGIDIRLSRANASKIALADEQTVSDNDRRYIETLFREDYETFGY